jgi:hypothetical protein
MAYFSNSSEGSCLDEQCEKCIFGELSCPIFLVQVNYNYEACNNKTAREILNTLIDNDGNCSMYKEFKNSLDRETNPDYASNKMQLKIWQLDKLNEIT